MRLFKAVVLDVWAKRTAFAREDRERLQQRVAAVRAKLDRLAAHLADETLDTRTYRRQRDRLEQDLMVAETTLEDAVTEHLDVEGILGFAEVALTDASRLWEHATPEHKRRLQRVLFPEGVVSSQVAARSGRPESFEHPQTALAFNGLSDSRDAKSALVALRVFEPRSDG